MRQVVVSAQTKNFPFAVTSYDENGEKVAFNQTSTFVVGAGGFGGKRSSDNSFPTYKHPDRPADAVLEERTSVDQVRHNVGSSSVLGCS